MENQVPRQEKYIHMKVVVLIIYKYTWKMSLIYNSGCHYVYLYVCLHVCWGILSDVSNDNPIPY